MKHHQWTELDYVAGAAHAEGMSYGRYVACGMPNLQRFKRRADAGEFDQNPVRARSRKDILAAVAAQDKPPAAEKPEAKKKRKAIAPELQVRVIPESKCKKCGAHLPAEKRAGKPRVYCRACVRELQKARQKAYHERIRSGQAKRPGSRLD